MNRAKISRLGDKLMGEFSKAVGYSGDLSDKSEFILYVSSRLTEEEKKALNEKVHKAEARLTCKVVLIGEPKLQ